MNIKELLLIGTFAACSCSDRRPSVSEKPQAQPQAVVQEQPRAGAIVPCSSGEQHDGWCRFEIALHNVRRIWGTSAKDVWAVGFGETALHWDGRSWSEVPKATDKALYALWGSGPNDVWAGGDDGVLVHWDGSAWSVVPSGTKQWIFGMWGSGPKDIWAVCSGGTTLHWDGIKWTVGRIGTPKDYFGELWGSGPSDVWAIAEGGVIAHWDGKRWAKVDGGVESDLQGIWGRRADDVWIVGDKGTLLHWDGTSWSLQTPRELSTTYFKAIAGSGDVVMLVTRGKDGLLDRILRRDGSTWTVVHDKTSSLLETIWVGEDGSAWAAGMGQKAWHLMSR